MLCGCDKSGLEMGVAISGDFVMDPGLFLGSTVACASYGTASAVDIPMSKTIGFFQGTGIGVQKVTPGVITITPKYKLSLTAGGTKVAVSAPWISVLPF
jgi:hypothetical protein